MHWDTRRFFSTVALLGIVAAGVPALAASAQTRSTARLTQALSGDFPQMSLFVAVDDASGGRAMGLTADQFQVIEDNQPRAPSSVVEEQVPTRQVFVVNTASGLGVRDSRGRTRFDFVRNALLSWWETPQTARYGQDDLSLVTGDATLVSHSAAAAELASAIDHHTPTFDPPTSGYDLLLQGLDVVSEGASQPGTVQIVIFFTSLPDQGDDAALANVIDRARQMGVLVYPVLIDTPQALGTPQADGLQQLAEQTGGQLTIFDPEQPLAGLGQRLQEQRLQYRLDYTSQANISGAHEVRVQVAYNGQSLATNTAIYTVDLQAPQVTFVQAPTQITRGSDDETMTPESLPPTQQTLKVLVTFPDGHDRPISRSELLVDGQIAVQNTSPPFDTFQWDLTPFRQSADHTLQAQVTDSLGLQAKSVVQPIAIDVQLPPSGLQAIGPALGSLLLVLVVLVGGVFAAYLLLSYGQRRSRAPVQAAPPAPSPGLRRLRRASLHRMDSSATPEAFLVPVNGQDGGSPIPLVGADISLGRDPSLSAFPLDDPSVSSLHARLIRQAGGSYLLRDQGSVAGTWINYERLTEEGQNLHHGDLVHLGRVAFRFRRPGAPDWPDISVKPAEDALHPLPSSKEPEA
jgi:pSer/pThr/pTyr-binding forkhead associated (FHA) protein